MGVVSVVVTSLNHLDIGICHTWLLGKFLAQEVVGDVEVAVEKPTYKSEGEHVAALHDGLRVHTRVSQAILHHLCDRTSDDTVGVDIHFLQWVVSCECSLF